MVVRDLYHGRGHVGFLVTLHHYKLVMVHEKDAVTNLVL